MQIRPDALPKLLNQPLAPLWAVHGDELLAIEAADAIRKAARQQGFDEREVLVAHPQFKWDELHHATANRSLFGGRTLIDLRIPSGKPGIEGAKALKQLASDCTAANASQPAETLVLISLPALAWQDEKAAWLTALADAGVVVKAAAPSAAEYPRWLSQRLAAQGQQAQPEALRFLVEHTEGNLLAAHQEIQKLALLFPAGTLDLESVRSAVLNVARYDLDDLRGAFLSGDMTRFQRTLSGLQQEGEALPLILWAMTEEIRALAQIRLGQAAGQSMPNLLKEARVWGPRQSLVTQALARCSAAALTAALQRLGSIDRMVKGVKKGDPWVALSKLVLDLQANAPHTR